ncbi:MAG: CRTAC1 family protein [Pseudomonadota bacterium]|nr:CRTAC1 family protein [Pseudomonadota bacterium]
MTLLRRHAARLLALAIILVLYGFARLPATTPQERQTLAERFRFTQLPLAELSGYPRQSLRQVNPSLSRFAAWISTVGAGVALNDLDGDGLANDLCQVEPRIDRVIVAPAPGTGDRYPPFALDPRPLPYAAATTAPMGCLPGDINEDGRIDLIVYYWGRTPVAFLRHGDGYRPQEIVDRPARWHTNSATLADLDGDGHLDLVIANYFPDGARILDPRATVPDAMQHSMSRAYNGGGTYFLLGDGSGFRKAATDLDPQVLHAWTLAVGAADLDGDLRPELYFANDFGPDRLLHNRSTPGRLRFALLEGRRGFATPASKALGHDSFKGMGVDFADLNGDGLADLFVSNIAAEYALEESHFAFVSDGRTAAMRDGVAPYADHSEPLGLSRSDWGWDAKFADFDNDGGVELIQATGFIRGAVDRWPELHELAMGNDELLKRPGVWPRFRPGDDVSGHAPNPFYVRGANGRFVDLAAELGLDQPYVSRGIAVADVDGDGDLDFALANQWEPSFFYRNDCPDCGAFLSLALRLPVDSDPAFAVRPGRAAGPSRPAVGAAARVTLPDGRVLVAQVDGGNGHGGRRSPELHFGLGRLPDAALAVELRWRDGGGVHTRTLELTPGPYTITLGAPG